MVEAGLRVTLQGPLFREIGKDDDDTFIFIVGQETALCGGAKSLGVFALDEYQIGIAGEDGVLRGVGSDPEKCLLPGVPVSDTGELYVCG